MSNSLRDRMPMTAKLIDQMRSVCGQEETDAILRKGISGQPGYFWACENGIEIGTRDTRAVSVIGWDAYGLSCRLVPQWMIDARRHAVDLCIAIRQHDPAIQFDAEREAAELREVLATVSRGLIQFSIKDKTK